MRVLPLFLLVACPKPPASTSAAPGAAGPGVTPLDLHPLEGPSKGEAAACTYLLERDARPPDGRWCDPVEYGSIDGTTSLPPEPGWAAVKLFPIHAPFASEVESEKNATMGGETVHLLLATDRGAYVGPPLADLWNPGAFGVHARMEVKRFEYVDLLPGGPREIVLHYAQDEQDTDMGAYEYTVGYYESLVVCTINPAGHPACNPPLLVGKVHGRLPISVDESAHDAPTEPYWRTAWSSSIDLGEGVIRLARTEVSPEPVETEDPRFAVEERPDPAMPPAQQLAPRFQPHAWEWPAE